MSQVKERSSKPLWGAIYRDDLLSPEVQGLSDGAFRLWATLRAWTIGDNDGPGGVQAYSVWGERMGEVHPKTVKRRAAELEEAGLLSREIETEEGYHGQVLFLGSVWVLQEPASVAQRAPMAQPARRSKSPRRKLAGLRKELARVEVDLAKLPPDPLTALHEELDSAWDMVKAATVGGYCTPEMHAEVKRLEDELDAAKAPTSDSGDPDRVRLEELRQKLLSAIERTQAEMAEEGTAT